MIEEEYISFETAKLAKEKGVDVPSDTGYYIDNGNIDYIITGWEDMFAPIYTQSLLARWLRESQHIYIDVSYVCKSGFYVQLMDMTKDEQHILVGTPIAFYETYEEAMEVGLKAALEYILEDTKQFN